VLRFQRRIYEELQGVGERPIPEGGESSPEGVRVTEAGRKANELGAELKNVTQLYNDYAVPFQLWETSLEILHFSSYEGDSGVLVRMWERLIAQGLEAGGVGEAAGRVRRVGGRLRVGAPGGGSGVPLEDVAYMLETAAHERTQRGQEMVSGQEVEVSTIFEKQDDF
jgi:nuclear pore complex protein Nup155